MASNIKINWQNILIEVLSRNKLILNSITLLIIECIYLNPGKKRRKSLNAKNMIQKRIRQ